MPDSLLYSLPAAPTTGAMAGGDMLDLSLLARRGKMIGECVRRLEDLEMR